jgi:hypothetical protein
MSSLLTDLGQRCEFTAITTQFTEAKSGLSWPKILISLFHSLSSSIGHDRRRIAVRRLCCQPPGKGCKGKFNQVLSARHGSISTFKVLPTLNKCLILTKFYQRVPANKPKPNTRFLRNIIKETDNHNAALLAKEAAESQARLHNLVTKDTRSGADIRRRQLGQITAHLTNRSTKRRRSDEDDRAEDHKRRRNTSSAEEEPSHVLESRTKHRDRHHRDREDVEDSREHRSSHQRSHKRHRSRSNDRSGRLNDENSRPRSRSPVVHRSRRSGHRHRSSDRHSAGTSSRREAEDTDRKHKRSHRHRRSPSITDDDTEKEKDEKNAKATDCKTAKVDDDSDPLDDIIGPRPPPTPKIRSRGRGTISAASGIDFRFSTAYDPTADVQLDPADEDDWDQALEALRDRQKWKQQGADRLRAAGFTEEEVEKWKKGGEKKEEDVRWAKTGESREWDKGKVFSADSDDELLPKEVDLEFGRLKGT